MRKTLCLCALLAVAALSSACSFKIFEDIGTDPHIPTIGVFALVHFVPAAAPEPVPTGAAADALARERAIFFDSGGFTLQRGKRFQITIAYSDAGGDIVKFHLRDRDGATQVDIVPVDQTYFAGTSGAGTVPTEGIEITGVSGTHRLELWAEDSHGSRSEKVEFVVTLAL